MIKLNQLLVAFDFSRFAEQALIRALQIARRFDASVHVFHADVLFSSPYDTIEPAPDGAPLTSLRDRVKAEVERIANDHDLMPEKAPITYAVTRDVAAAPAIGRYAEESDIDLVVMGTHGRRGVRRLLLGSVAEEVVRQAPCPVLTVQGREESATALPRTVLVPIDFSAHSREALHVAKEIIAPIGARLKLLHVIEEQLHPAFYNTGVFSVYDVDPEIEEKAARELKALYEEAPGPASPDGAAPTVAVRSGNPAHQIIAYADKEDVDLILMATHGRGGLKHFLLGTVAGRVVRRAPCSVFTVKSFGRTIVVPETTADASEAV